MNRGLAGIDGVLSSALGFAENAEDGKGAVLLVGMLQKFSLFGEQK